MESGVGYLRDLNLSDSLNNLGAGMGASSSEAHSGLSTGNWGVHSSNIQIDSPTLGFGKILMIGGVVLIGYWLFKKIAR